MFDKLKIKLTLINLGILTFFLFFIFIGIYMMMKESLNTQSENMLNSMANGEHFQQPRPGAPNAGRFQSNSFFIRMDIEGKVLETSQNLVFSKNETDVLTSKTFKSSNKRGELTYNHLDFKYLKVQKKYGYMVVFLDTAQDRAIISQLVITSLVVGVISLVAVFLVSLFLANRALIPIKKAWERQKAFIADASHELRTPITVINTNLDVVLDNSSETVDSQVKWFDNIQMEIKRMAKLVDDLLFLARSDYNEETFLMTELLLSNTLNQAILPFEPLALSKGVILEVEIQPEIFVWGNEGRLKQLIANIIDNAIKHTPEGGKVSVKMKAEASIIKITVKDDGEGIPENHIGKIFERFYRVDKSRSRNYNGTGLGLSIAYCIVKEHKGSISVASSVGRGSTFHISLPKIK